MLLIKVPGKNGLGMTAGVENAPDKILEEYINVEKIELNPSDIEEQEVTIYQETKKMMNQKPFFIGGDHSISYPLIKKFIEFNKNPGIIILDAHPDLMLPTQNPTHEEWLAAIIRETKIKPENILLIGARNIDPAEKEYSINTIAIQDLSNCNEKIKNFSKDKNLYLSIDIDFFDSSIASATGYPEKEGATKQQGIELIKNILQTNKVKAADLVEINPTKNRAEQTINLAKEIIKTFEEVN